MQERRHEFLTVKHSGSTDVLPFRLTRTRTQIELCISLMSAAAGLLVLLSAGPVGAGTGATPFLSKYPATLTSFEWQTITSPQYVGESLGVVVLAKDESGNSYPYNGSALLSTSSGSYVYPTIVQFRNGVCGTNVIVTIAENLSLRCFTDSASGSSNTFAVLPGAPERLVAILPGEQLAPGIPGGRSGRPADRTAGDTFNFEVFLTDEWFNRVDESNDSVYFGSDDGFGQLPAGGELSNGTGSFAASLRTAGQHHIFTAPGLGKSLRADTSSAVSVFAGPYTQMLLLAPGETLLPGDTTTSLWESPGKGGTPNPQYLRTPFPITVYACDRCWNLVTGPDDTVYLQSYLPMWFSPWGDELLDSAVFGVQFLTPGPNAVIWACLPAIGDYSYATYLNVRALGVTLEVTAPDTIRSGETTQVRTRVLDANGDPVVAGLVQYSVVKGSGTILDPALLTDTIGYATARFVCTPSPASEQDSIRISSGEADTVIGIYVRHLSDSLFAFPNPFGSINRDRTQIFYSLHRASSVRVTIYDPFGNEVWEHRYKEGEPGGRFGDNTVYWDGTNNRGRRVASGIYLIQVLGTRNTGIDFRSLYRIGVVW